MTAATLRSHTAKDLAQMARLNGISGWHSMRKEELVSQLARIARRRALTENGDNGTAASSNRNSRSNSPRVQQKIDQLKRKLANAKNLAVSPPDLPVATTKEDRLVVMVRDPYWLHAFWELSQRSVDRAQAAMGQHWHTSRPVLRLFRMEEAGTASLERDIVIHGGVNNWYIDVQNPPCEFRLEVGYLAENSSFYCLARSNTVQTPLAGTSDAVDDNWKHVAEQADRIFAMSGGYSPQGTSRELQELLEERLRRPLGTPMHTRYGTGAGSMMHQSGDMPFAVDAEVIVYGAADRNAHVTLKGEPVQLRADGTFAVRLSLPDKRQVIPIVASSGDGVEQRTIILAIERNTKVMETKVRDITAR